MVVVLHPKQVPGSGSRTQVHGEEASPHAVQAYPVAKHALDEQGRLTHSKLKHPIQKALQECEFCSVTIKLVKMPCDTIAEILESIPTAVSQYPGA